MSSMKNSLVTAIHSTNEFMPTLPILLGSFKCNLAYTISVWCNWTTVSFVKIAAVKVILYFRVRMKVCPYFLHPCKFWVKFGIRGVHKNSVNDSCIKWKPLLRVWMYFYQYIHIYCPIWVKFHIRLIAHNTIWHLQVLENRKRLYFSFGHKWNNV